MERRKKGGGRRKGRGVGAGKIQGEPGASYRAIKYLKYKRGGGVNGTQEPT